MLPLEDDTVWWSMGPLKLSVPGVNRAQRRTWTGVGVPAVAAWLPLVPSVSPAAAIGTAARNAQRRVVMWCCLPNVIDAFLSLPIPERAHAPGDDGIVEHREGQSDSL